MLDEVIRAVYYVENDARAKSRGYKDKITINIYMHVDFWNRCISNLHQGISSVEAEFLRSGTIFGHKVYRVVDKHTRFEVVQIS